MRSRREARRRAGLLALLLVIAAGGAAGGAACGAARPERRPAAEEDAEAEPPPTVPVAPALTYCEGVPLPPPPTVVVLPADQAEAQTLEAEAWQAVTLGDDEAALEAAEAAAAKDPWSFRARMAQGVVRSRLGRHEAALEAFCAARALDESSAKALYWIGYTRVEQGRTAEGIRAIRAVLEREPDGKEAWYELGYALTRTGAAADLPEALTAFDRAVALGQDDGKIHYERGYVLFRLERPAEAAAAYAVAAKKRPLHAATRRELAAALVATERAADAEREARKAIRLEDTHPDGHYWLGRALLLRRRCEKAQRAFLDAVHVAPEGLKDRYQRWVEDAKTTCGR